MLFVCVCMFGQLEVAAVHIDALTMLFCHCFFFIPKLDNVATQLIRLRCFLRLETTNSIGIGRKNTTFD